MDAAPTRIEIRKTPGFRKRYDFFENGISIGSVEYPKVYRHLAQCSFRNEHYSIKRTGFWKFLIEVIPAENHSAIKIPFNWCYRISLRDASGTLYTFRQTSWWKNTWAWMDESKNHVIEIRSRMMSKKNRASVYVNQPFGKEITLFILTGWFLIIAYEDDMALNAVVG